MASVKIPGRLKYVAPKGENGKCKSVRLSEEARKALEAKYNNSKKPASIFDGIDLSEPIQEEKSAESI